MNSNLESLGRLRLQAILLLLAVFVIGALAGAAFERGRWRRWPPPPPPPPPHGLPPGLREELHLTPDQATRIEEILDRSRARTDVVLDQFLPRLRAVTDSIRAEVRAVLTPEQQKRFDRLQPPGGPPFGPPPFGPPPGGPPHESLFGRPPPGEPPPAGH